jgi:hypothetical protein
MGWPSNHHETNLAVTRKRYFTSRHVYAIQRRWPLFAELLTSELRRRRLLVPEPTAADRSLAAPEAAIP